jgi:hypothetical protein
MKPRLCVQRFMARRMGAKTVEVRASHVSLISQPEVIAKLIPKPPDSNRSTALSA